MGRYKNTRMSSSGMCWRWWWELEIVKQERDILKKAIQVFSRGES